ncbi:hypothetical protein JZU48_01055, partial [bacterium]|nr:hypothetical protein [bacterium]
SSPMTADIVPAARSVAVFVELEEWGMSGAASRFRFVDFFVRWLFTFVVIAAFYNPTGYSYVDWLLVADSEYAPVKMFIGLTLLLLLWFIYRMTMRAMKSLGVLLGWLVFGVSVWALDNLGVRPRTLSFFFVLCEACLAAWLAFGMSLVLLRQHVSGIVTSNDEH